MGGRTGLCRAGSLTCIVFGQVWHGLFGPVGLRIGKVCFYLFDFIYWSYLLKKVLKRAVMEVFLRYFEGKVRRERDELELRREGPVS